MASSHHFTLPRQVSAHLTPPLCCCAILLLPRRAHPPGRLCTTPLVSVCRKYKVLKNILGLSGWTLNVPFWYRFGAYKKTSISRCLAQKSIGVHGHTSKLFSELLEDTIFRPR